MPKDRSSGSTADLFKLWTVDAVILICLLVDAANKAGCGGSVSGSCVIINGFSLFVGFGWVAFGGLTIIAGALTLMFAVRGRVRRR